MEHADLMSIGNLFQICLVRQIEKHASQNLFLLGGEKEAVNWMNGDFWLAYNGVAWKQGSLGIVNVMICM